MKLVTKHIYLLFRRNLSLRILLFFFVGVLKGQTVDTFTAKVLDFKTLDPVPGASIKHLNLLVTETDFDGNFFLSNVRIGDLVEVSFPGYTSEKYTITESTTDVVIYLKEDVQELDEVVVTGYGKQKKKDVTGSISFIEESQIADLNPVKIEQALQGTIAGVNITSQSGSPGAGLNIRIRGISTNGDASPVVIIDGYQGDLNSLNPSDIASITVLKDAQAAIYGTIAANGVILVTTKNAKDNQPLSISVDGSLGYQQTSRYLPLLNEREYGILLNESFTNDGRFPVVNNTDNLKEGFNWQNAVFKSAPILRNSLQLSGGSKSVNYSLGASILDQKGIVGLDKSKFTRNTLRSNISYKLTDNLKLNTSLIFSRIDRNSLNEFGLGSVLFNAINMPPTINDRDDDGNLSLAPSNLGIEIINPLAQISNTYNSYNLSKINGTLGLEFNPVEDLTITSRIGFNSSFSKSKVFSKEIDYGGKVFDVTRSSVNQNRINDNDYTFDLFANYIKEFDKHALNSTLGTTVYKTYGNALFATGFDVPNNDWMYADISLANGVSTEKATGSYTYDQRRLSYFGRVQYSYDDKLFVSSLLRRDSSSKFGPKNRVGIFPSITAGYLFKNLMDRVDFIDFLKLRGSYGILGSDKIGDYLYLSQLNGEGVYVFDNQLSFGRAIGVSPNPTIKWEESEQFDIGLDFTSNAGTYNIILDYFIKQTNDLLIQNIPVSGIIGTFAPGSGSPTVNAGGVKNSGVEFMISHKKSYKNIYLSTSFNMTYLKNVVTKVNNSTGFIEGGSFGVGQPAPSRMEKGFPIGYFYGYVTDGIFQNRADVITSPSQLELGAEASPGDLKYKDINNDGVINAKDRTYIGDPIPDFNFGFNSNISYKNFELSFNLFASVGQEIVRNYERNQLYTNKMNYVIERWRGEGTSTSIPRLTTKATTNTVFSNYFVEDGSFIRLQTVQFGYNVSSNFIDKLNIKQFRLFISADNLVTLTKYKGFDPSASSGAPIGSGIDYGFYPTPKVISSGFRVKF